MNQQELEALLAQIAPNNDPRRLEFSESTDTIEVEERPSQYAPPTKVKRPVRVLTWVDRGTGQMLTVQVDPTTGTYTKTFQGIDPKAQGAPAVTPAQQAATAPKRTEKPVDIGGKRYIEVTEEVETPEGGRRTRTFHLDPATNQEVQPPTPGTAPTRSEKPVDIAGRRYIEVTETVDGPEGKRTRVYHVDPQTRAEVQPATPRPNEEISRGTGPGGADQRIVRDPQTGQVVGYEPIPGAEGKDVYQPLPAGVPRYTPNLTSMDLGLGDRKAQLDDLIRQGLIDKATALQVIKGDEGTARAAASNAGAIVNIQEGIRNADLTARGQDITDASSRRSFAGSTYNQTLSSLAPLAAQFRPGPGAGEAAAKGFEAMLGMARGHADASGGMAAPRGYDPSQYPMLGAYGRAGMPGLPGGPPLGTQWVFGPNGPMPAPPPGTLPGQLPLPPGGVSETTDAGGVPRVRTPASATTGPTVPNAIGLGAIGSLPAPGGPAPTSLPDLLNRPPRYPHPWMQSPAPLPGPAPGMPPGPYPHPWMNTPAPLPGPAPGMAPGPVTVPGMAPGAAPGPVPVPAAPPAAAPGNRDDGFFRELPPLPGMPPPVPMPDPTQGLPPQGPPPVPLPDYSQRIGASPAAGLLRQSWAQQANPGYDPRMTGLDEDLLRTGFDPDVIGLVLGGGRQGF